MKKLALFVVALASVFGLISTANAQYRCNQCNRTYHHSHQQFNQFNHGYNQFNQFHDFGHHNNVEKIIIEERQVEFDDAGVRVIGVPINLLELDYYWYYDLHDTSKQSEEQ